MRHTLHLRIAIATTAVAAVCSAQAGVVRVNQSAFTAQAGLITFSEFAVGTVNPTYTAASYGGGATAPTVNFGGYFVGQSLGNAATCPTGAALSGCVVGSPTSGLQLDAASPATRIVSDSSNPTSPVLSGSPLFNGPVSILFSTDQYGVGLVGGFFDAAHSTGITAFDRSGHSLGVVSNNGLGIEFLGLVTNDGLAEIAGLQFSLVGAEPAGFAIDNLRFGVVGQVVAPGLPEPGTYALAVAGLGVMGVVSRRRKSEKGTAEGEAGAAA